MAQNKQKLSDNVQKKKLAYLNCDNNPLMGDVFSDFDTERIIRNFAAITNTSVVPHDTLIVLDEIQKTPQGLAVLKYFCENAPQYHIAVAGSLLSIALHQYTSFFAGKVDTFELFLMSFTEFMMALGENEKFKMKYFRTMWKICRNTHQRAKCHVSIWFETAFLHNWHAKTKSLFTEQ